MIDAERCTDDGLRLLARESTDPLARAAAAELLAIRSERRRDSRRAEQIKKLRWAIEHAVTRLDAVPDLVRKWEGDERCVGLPSGAELRAAVRAIVREAMRKAATLAARGELGNHPDFDIIADEAMHDICGPEVSP